MTAWASRHHRALFYGVLVLWTVVMIAFLPRHLMHVFGG
jgi:succinate dehydrogenase / fumarate reductase cytochrome b subunit